MATRVLVAGTGAHLPPDTLTSAEIEARHGLPARLIEDVTGIRERRVAAPDRSTGDLAVDAARDAIRDAGIDPLDVELLILATATPDHPVPATAPRVAHELGLHAPAFDLSAACSGFAYGLGLADRWLKQSPRQGHALVVGAAVISRRLDWRDPVGAALYGDGAGAVVLRPAQTPHGILSAHLASDGSRWDQVHVPAGGARQPVTVDVVAQGGHLMRTEKSRAALETSIRHVVLAGQGALREAAMGPDRVDHFLPSQSTRRLVDGACAGLHVPAAKALVHLDRYANMSAAAMPVALHEAAREGRLQPGQRVLMASVGAGLSSGGIVLEWGTEADP